jgi:hypothetical protein
MSDRKTPTRFSKDLRGGSLESAPIKPAATGANNAERIRGRHGAITNNFNKLRSYEDWAAKIHGAWEENNK